MLPLCKQTREVASFDSPVSFVKVKAVAANHLVDLIKYGNCIQHRFHLQEMLQGDISNDPLVEAGRSISVAAPESQEAIQADYDHFLALEGQYVGQQLDNDRFAMSRAH
jgi:hypothetical protein